ncbi:hypothetical protein [Symbioplanes lichenis]|uniref:hypothetical protein n=1 Tax=Symbioplanes lichenis TaxID=1629072 RepID=UPI002738AA20|nr:hypothetical protein [Actinoplanes lichenis]
MTPPCPSPRPGRKPTVLDRSERALPCVHPDAPPVLTPWPRPGFDGYEELLARLGPHTTGKSCLHLKRPAAVDEQALRELVTAAFRHLDGRTLTA